MRLTLLGLEPTDSLSSLFEEYLSERLHHEPIGDSLGDEPKYTLLDNMGFPVPCRICGEIDQWVREGIVFVCEHEPSIHIP